MLAVLIMYMFGGVGIHGFSYAMICGVVVGTYSTVGVAAPLLHRPKTLNIVVFIMVALGALGIYSVAVDDIMSNVAMTAIVGVVVLGGLAWAIMRELRGGRSGSAAGTV
jgi:hypothetical protein